MLDFFLALLINIKGIFAVLFWVSMIAAGITLVAGGFMKMMETDQYGRRNKDAADHEDWAKWRRFQKWAVICCLITGPFYSLPDMEDLWHVRINMLKFHMASPSNVEAFAKNGMPHIERVAKKIECRFLGCPDAEKEKLGVKENPKTTQATKEITDKVVEKVADKIVNEVTK